jgi:hypothetical protein
MQAKATQCKQIQQIEANVGQGKQQKAKVSK